MSNHGVSSEEENTVWVSIFYCLCFNAVVGIYMCWKQCTVKFSKYLEIKLHT